VLIHVDGRRLFALEAGQGEPALVFIHGNGSDHTAWHHQIAFFSPLTRVIAVDLRGHGQSSRDPGRDYSYEAILQDLVLCLDALDVGPSVLVGWSMGGNIAALFACQHPSQTAGLVLVDNNSVRQDIGLDPRRAEETVRYLAEDFEGEGVRRFIDNWFPESGPEIEALKQWQYETCRRAGQEVVYGIRSRGVRREGRPDWLEMLAMPVLVLQGGASLLGGHPMGERLAQLIDDAQLHVFEGKGHAPHLTATDEFNRVLKEFFLEIRAGS
jgi:3-oxoadipate enol-lactonase